MDSWPGQRMDEVQARENAIKSTLTDDEYATAVRLADRLAEEAANIRGARQAPAPVVAPTVVDMAYLASRLPGWDGDDCLPAF